MRAATRKVAPLKDRLAQAERRSAELAMIADAAGTLALSLDVTAVSSIIVRTAIELTGAAECSLWLATGEAELDLLASASGMPSASVIPPAERWSLLRQALSSSATTVLGGETGCPGLAGYAVLRLSLPTHRPALMELIGFPVPQNAEEQLATLRQALPIASLSLQNALTTRENAAVSSRLKEALDDLQRRQVLLEEQNEEIVAQSAQLQRQNEEIQAQSDELHAQNERLAVQEERTRAIVDATSDGLLVVDGQHRVIAINPAFEALTGYTADEIVGHNCVHLLDARRPDRVSICDVACPHLHERGLGPSNVDVVLTTKNGSEMWVNVAYGAIYGRDDRPTTVVHAVRDISARKELEGQKDDFLTSVAHDLKNPLAAIRGHSQLLLHRLLRSAAGEDLVKPVKAVDLQVGRMVSLIDELLDITRLQMGRYELDTEPVDLLDLTHHVLDQAQVTTDRHRITIEEVYPSLVGSWDRGCIERILANLIENAIKYSPDGGEIALLLRGAFVAPEAHGAWPRNLNPCSSGQPATWAIVSVADRGHGIAPEDQGHLFERYYRTHSARKEAKGFGLGLFISRGLVEAHGGHIWVESRLGLGSTFHFALPLGAG